MIDLLNESPISLAEAARLLPPGRSGKAVSFSCVLRWVLHGVRSPSGQTVRLAGLRLGARWVTSKQAIQRFCEALTPQLDGANAKPRTPTARQRAADRAGRELEKLGV